MEIRLRTFSKGCGGTGRRRSERADIRSVGWGAGDRMPGEGETVLPGFERLARREEPVPIPIRPCPGGGSALVRQGFPPVRVDGGR